MTTLAASAAYAAGTDTGATLGSSAVTATVLNVGDNPFQIQVWASGGLQSDKTGTATVVNKYFMAADGTVTPSALPADVTTLTFTPGVNYSQDCSGSTPPKGCANNPFSVAATITVAAGTPAGTTGTLTVSETGSPGLGADGSPYTGYLTVGGAVIDPCAGATVAAPVFSPNPATDADGANGWFITTPVVSATSSTSGATVTYATAAGGPYSSTPPVLTDGMTTVWAKATTTCVPGGSTNSATFYVDTTAPAVVAVTLGRLADHNGWYNHAVGYAASGTDATSGVDSCTTGTYSTPDSATATVTGTCTDLAGNTSALATSAAFQYDGTAPSGVTVTLDRAADHNGWYNHAVGYTASGTDATSGVDSCTTGTYSTPDSATATVTGTCTDLAGNTSALATSAAFQYDGTLPTLSPTVSPNPVVLGGSATASPNASDATSGVDSASCASVLTTAVGTNSVSCSATDVAGNTNTASASYSVLYSTGSCLGSPGHAVLQPVNSDGTSVFKKGSTVPVKFRVCDANGNSIGTPGVVTGAGAPVLVGKSTGAGGVDESVISTTPDTAFRWDATSQQWIFNQSTKNLVSGVVYHYEIPLNDGSVIDYTFGVK